MTVFSVASDGLTVAERLAVWPISSEREVLLSVTEDTFTPAGSVSVGSQEHRTINAATNVAKSFKMLFFIFTGF